jgi:hypothetical protein
MGDTASNDIIITSYDGLDYISPEYQSEVYVNENGKVTTSKYIPARVITLQILIDSRNKLITENAIKVLSRGGTLIIQHDDKVRKIDCQCANFARGERNQAFTIRSLQFECDKVNFEDLYPTKETLFELVNHLSGNFTLPFTPTTLTTEKDIYNLGYLVVQPIIYITNTGTAQGVQPPEYGFEVLNQTHNQKIRLNYHTTLNEVIKIDIYNREIISSLGTNLINYISSDTDLEAFFYDLGVNHIKFNNYNVEEVLTAYTEYSNLWIEVL